MHSICLECDLRKNALAKIELIHKIMIFYSFDKYTRVYFKM